MAERADSVLPPANGGAATMASQFQIFELITHAPASSLERKETWPPFETREQAVERIENVIGRHSLSGYDDKVQSWWAITVDGASGMNPRVG